MEFRKARAHNDLVLVTPITEDHSKIGAIHVPQKFQQQSNQGIVVSIGPDVYDDSHTAYLKTGDKITYGIGNAETVMIEDVEHKLIRSNDIRLVESLVE